MNANKHLTAWLQFVNQHPLICKRLHNLLGSKLGNCSYYPHLTHLPLFSSPDATGFTHTGNPVAFLAGIHQRANANRTCAFCGQKQLIFLTQLLKANSGKNMPVESITVWFEPEQIYFRLQLVEDVLPATLGTTLDVVGTVAITDGHLTIDLQEAAAGPYTVSGAILAPINAQLNNALAGAVMSIPVVVTIDSGKLMIGITQ